MGLPLLPVLKWHGAGGALGLGSTKPWTHCTLEGGGVIRYIIFCLHSSVAPMRGVAGFSDALPFGAGNYGV